MSTTFGGKVSADLVASTLYRPAKSKWINFASALVELQAIASSSRVRRSQYPRSKTASHSIRKGINGVAALALSRASERCLNDGVSMTRTYAIILKSRPNVSRAHPQPS